MNQIVKEELWRCAGTLWFAVFFSVFVIVPRLGASFMTIILIPITITLLVCLTLIIIRGRKILWKN